MAKKGAKHQKFKGSQSYHTGIEIYELHAVLISHPTFNRTILELKFSTQLLVSAFLVSFNRTILELKFGKGKAVRKAAFTFNRTTLELK